MVCRPNRMIKAPAILLITAMWFTRNRPTAVAEAPKAVKTKANPRTKNTELQPALFIKSFLSAPLESSSKDSPDMKEMYPGTKGKTQGDRKETTPATKAVHRLTWLVEFGGRETATGYAPVAVSSACVILPEPICCSCRS